MKQFIKNNIEELYCNHFGEKILEINKLPASGSYREYYRIYTETRTIIGVYNEDIKENRAFYSFADHFNTHGINVPKILAISPGEDFYLLEDLGDLTLFEHLSQNRKGENLGDSVMDIYKKVINDLPKIQVEAGRGIDYSKCYPRAAFDRQSMMWDLNYFKYYFLKLAKVSFDEQALETDFESFCTFLLSAENDFFLFRDFQSRNIMLKDNVPYYIDFQGGRKGALQYDLASLLYDGKADISNQTREYLYGLYVEELKKYLMVNEKEFKSYYKGFVLIRIMQAMGAYGFRGFYEKKEHFLKSIPFALNNLAFLLKDLDLPVDIPELRRVLEKISTSKKLREIVPEEEGLAVRITSFSYKKGIPQDPTNNGGGFVFDCRAINNPGRLKEYQSLTGKDKAVQEFLEKKSDMSDFMESVYKLVGKSVEVYLDRGFSHLCVNFGCTGGQHRSVYGAEKLAAYLQNNFKLKVVLKHREQEE